MYYVELCGHTIVPGYSQRKCMARSMNLSRLGRVGVGIDLNEEYYEMGLRRTGITMTRNGKRLEKVKARKTNAKSKYVRGE